MYILENMTQAPIDFALVVEHCEALSPGEPDRKFRCSGDKFEGKPSERNAWSIPWSDDLRKPSSVEVTDGQYAELSGQRLFKALLDSGNLRATKRGA